MISGSAICLDGPGAAEPGVGFGASSDALLGHGPLLELGRQRHGSPPAWSRLDGVHKHTPWVLDMPRQACAGESLPAPLDGLLDFGLIPDGVVARPSKPNPWKVSSRRVPGRLAYHWESLER